MPASLFQPGDPFCTQCGFLLRGHEADARCPECGAPLPAAIKKYDPEMAKQLGVLAKGPRSRSAATLFGWPLVDIAFGPDPERGERIGKARGIIAIGNIAVGGVAIGGISVGVVAIGGVSQGVVAIGGVSLGLLAAAGGLAIGGHVTGGAAIGGIATGGMAVGYVAQGGVAVGTYSRGGVAKGSHAITAASADPEAIRVFHALSPVVGTSGASGLVVPGGAMQPVLVPVLAGGLLAAVIGAVVVLAQRRYDGSNAGGKARKRLDAIADDLVGPVGAGRAGGRR